MMEKQKNIPELRFPEFEGEWEKKRLGEVTDLITKGTTPNRFVAEGIRFIKIECFDGDIINPDKCLFIDEITHNKELKRSILKENDLLFAIAGATIGKVNFVKKEILPANTNQALSIIRLKGGEIRNFIYQILKSNGMQKYIKDSISVGAQPNLNLEQMGNFAFPYPSHIEQQKIADFFSAIDQKIHSLKKKKTLLEEYKKGVMQKIFSQEIRFKQDDGQDFPEWEKEPFGNIYSFLITNSLSRENLTYDTGEVKNIHYGDIHTKFKCQFKVENELVPYVKYDITISRYNEENYCKAGDLIFADASEDYDDIGKAIEIVSTNAEKILSGLHTIHARPESNRMQVGFAAYLMQSSFVRREIMRISQGTKVLSISATRLKDVLIKVPHKAEQLKIANLLAALDLKIERLDSQIVGMESWKKGLLQQMFC